MATFTLTGTFKHQDGVTPVVGSPIQVYADPFTVAGAVLVAGQTVTTNSSGQVTMTLTTGITGLYYVARSLAFAPLFKPIRFAAPGVGATLDFSTLVSYNPSGDQPFLAQVLAVTSPRQLPQANAAGVVGPFAPAAQINTNENLQAVGYDQTDGLLILASNTALVTSTNLGVTTTGDKGVPIPGQSNSGNQIAGIVRFGALWVCLINDLTGKAAVYTSPAPGTGGTCTWTLRQNLTTGSVGSFSTCIDTDGTQILVGEYGDPLVTAVPTPHVWRSTNGTAWTSVFSLTGSGARHIHAVYADSYVTNQWWMSLGDGPSPCLYRSLDGGVTWTGVTAIDSTRQVVQISDDPTYLYLAADATGIGTPCDLWVLDKATLTSVRSGSMGTHRSIAVPDQGAYTTGYTVVSGSHLQDFQASNFASHVIGARVVASSVTAGTTITAVNSTSDVTLSAAPSAAGPIKYKLMGVNEKWFGDPFFGIIDPATGVYYFTTPGDSTGDTNTRRGLFCIPYLGGPVLLLDHINCAPRSIFMAAGWLYCGNRRRPLLVPA